MMLAPVILVVFIGFSALAVDISAMRTAKAQLRGTLDAATLAAVNALPEGNNSAIQAAQDVLTRNDIIGGSPLQNVEIKLGQWDSDERTFTETNNAPNAVRVNGTVTPPLFFAKMLTNSDTRSISSSSTASTITGGRDIVFAIATDMAMAAYNHATIVSLNVLSAAQWQTLQRAVYDAFGFPPSGFGNLTWTPQTIGSSYTTAQTLTMLGLSGLPFSPVPCPNPSGTQCSWNLYVSDVRGGYSILDRYPYRYQYSLYTLINSITQRCYTTAQPNCWKTPTQPWQTLRESVRDFIDLNLQNGDRVSLITFEQCTTRLDVPLTTDVGSIERTLFGNISTNTPGRQPRYWSCGTATTNSVAPMNMAINELIEKSNPQKVRIIYYFLALGNFNNSDVVIDRARDNQIVVNVINMLHGQTYLSSATSRATQLSVISKTGGSYADGAMGSYRTVYSLLRPLVNFSAVLQQMYTKSLTSAETLYHIDPESASNSGNQSAQIVQ